MLLRQRDSALLGGHAIIKITSLKAIAAALLACGVSTAPTLAGPNRTFVSGHGTDSGACALAAPCRTFAFALNQTNAGGEIDVLDPAGYGTVAIIHAISIVNDGVGVAAIGAPSVNTITINAGPTDSVHLRGLTIAGLSSGLNGIQFNTGGNLAIENCVVRGFNDGINIATSASSSFSVSNTIASNNVAGISVAPTGSPVVTGVLSKVITNKNVDGIIVNGLFTTGRSLNVTIVDSEASNNGNFGVAAASASGHAATGVMLRNVVASNNNIGLDASGTAILRVGHSVVTGNVIGLFTFGGGIINSYSDNDIDGNTNDNLSVLTTIPTH